MPANKGVQAVSQAKNATSAGQKAVTFVRAAGTEVGKDLLNGALSTGVGYGVTELTGNQELGMTAGVLSSFAFGAELDAIDESLNISVLSRPKGLPKTANYADDIDLSTSHAKSSAYVDIVRPNNFFDNQNFNNPSRISGSDYKNADYLTTNGNKYQHDFEARPVGDYNINHNKDYVTNTSQADIDFQKPKSYQNRLVTEAIGYADDLPVPKAASSMQDNFFFVESGNGSSYSWTDGYAADRQYLGSGRIGDFSDLEGKSIQEVLTRIPPDATRRELTPIAGKVTEGFEYKWVENGKTYRVRIHGVDPSAPAGSNASKGWIVRVQQGKKYLDPVTIEYQPRGISDINSPNYNEEIANRTHIPIKTPKENK